MAAYSSSSPVRSFRGAVAGFWRSLSVTGLVLATLFFVASLTPSLIPRSFPVQGALSGACFAAGYGIGVSLRWLWTFLELPEPRESAQTAARTVVVLASFAVVPFFLWRAAEWQNSIRTLMELEPLTTAHPVEVCLVAVLTFLVLIALVRLFKAVARMVSRRSARLVPRRVSQVVGFGAAALLFLVIANGVLFRFALRAVDSSFASLDALIEPDRERPEASRKTGSSASLLTWEELGRAGREFISTGPTAAAIGAVTRREAFEPIRVYVGLSAAETAEQRAGLALQEMQRVGAFDRSVLILITPTGTGWIDPAAIDTVEYLLNGDVASVALQYSYLSSPLSLLVEPDYGSENARALFAAVYGYWTELPKDRRPALYLHGLSLGAKNSETATEFFELLGDPIQGALWSGPPFGSRIWRRMTEERDPGSPAWLPRFRDGRLVRFMNQNGGTLPANSPWGPMRIVYLQYASDPVTFFDQRDLYRRPLWLDPPRGPDVSPQLRWYPVVTMLQMAFDMAVATTTPTGYGHVFAPEHYVDAWIEVTGAEEWSAEGIAALKRHLTGRYGT